MEAIILGIEKRDPPLVVRNHWRSVIFQSHLQATLGGCEYWVDQDAGSSPEEPTVLIKLLLAIADGPEALRTSFW